MKMTKMCCLECFKMTNRYKMVKFSIKTSNLSYLNYINVGLLRLVSLLKWCFGDCVVYCCG